MKRYNSLKDKKEFDKLLKSGKRKYTQYLSIYWKENPNPLVGISVPKKIANAVNRNKNKRILKNILDEINFFDNYKIKIVFIIKEDFLLKKYSEKKKIVEGILSNIKKH